MPTWIKGSSPIQQLKQMTNFENGKEYDYVVQDYIEVLPKTSIYPNNLFTTRDTEQLKSALKENGASQSTIDDVKKDNNYMFLVTCINWG